MKEEDYLFIISLLKGILKGKIISEEENEDLCVLCNKLKSLVI